MLFKPRRAMKDITFIDSLCWTYNLMNALNGA